MTKGTEDRPPASPDPPGDRPSADHRRIGAALAYVPQVARRFQGRGVPFDELVAAGNLGLVEAALRYQPARNIRFVTYADWWIRKSIFETIREHAGPVRLPRYRREQLRSLREGRQALRRRNGDEPGSAELAKLLGMTVDQVERLRELGRGSLSLEETSRPDGDRPLRELLADEDEPGPHDALVRNDLLRHLRSRLAGLGRRERAVVALRFGLGDGEALSLRRIAARLGISRERVRQLERRALLELRNSL